MPELPEVETVRRTLKNFILDAKIVKVSVLYQKIISGDAGVFAAAVSGQAIRDIDRSGKYLIFVLDEIAFISHLRMEGKFNIVCPDTEINKHEHIIFYLADGRELRYQDTRKFGRMELVGRDTYRSQKPLSKLGPEPFAADPDTVYKRLNKSRVPIKSLLLDQSILNGIGNIYANEICWRLKMNPLTPGNQISRKQTKGLIQAAAEILTEAIALGGTTIHSFDAGGITGRFQTKLKIHTQKNCPFCHEPVTKIMVGGRGTYYCGQCQTQGIAPPLS
jgi:formamidopyrimidine-DNA glycosylase